MVWIKMVNKILQYMITINTVAQLKVISYFGLTAALLNIHL